MKIRTSLSDPTINEPMLPMDALSLIGRVPPNDGGKAVGEYLDREIEIGARGIGGGRRVTRRRGATPLSVEI